MNPFEIPIDIYLDFDKKHNHGCCNGAFAFGVAIKSIYKPLKRLRDDLDKCEQNHDLIKYFFNAGTEINAIRAKKIQLELQLSEFINKQTF